MECPPGMTDAEEDDVLVLNKFIYGLVHAARQYHMKAIEVLCKIGFNYGGFDPFCPGNNVKESCHCCNICGQVPDCESS